MIPSVTSSGCLKCASLIERVTDLTSLTPLVVQFAFNSKDELNNVDWSINQEAKQTPS